MALMSTPAWQSVRRFAVAKSVEDLWSRERPFVSGTLVAVEGGATADLHVSDLTDDSGAGAAGDPGLRLVAVDLVIAPSDPDEPRLRVPLAIWLGGANGAPTGDRLDELLKPLIESAPVGARVAVFADTITRSEINGDTLVTLATGAGLPLPTVVVFEASGGEMVSLDPLVPNPNEFYGASSWSDLASIHSA